MECSTLLGHLGQLHKVQGTLWKRNRMEESEDGMERCQMLLSGYGVVVVLMNSEQLCLPTQGQAS